MSQEALVLVSPDNLQAMIRAAVRDAMGVADKKPAPRPAELLSTAQVRAEYRIGRAQLLQYGDSGRLPYVRRLTRGGYTTRCYRREDCDRVLADTLHRF